MNTGKAGKADEDAPVQDPLQQALDRMWLQFLPTMKERVGILDAAAADSLSEDDRDAARAAAHKLAGALGTFGLAEGTMLAREAEQLCDAGAEPDIKRAERLAEIAKQLRSLIENRR